MPIAPVNEHIRYESDQRCPPAVSIGVGLQGVLLIVAPLVVNVAVVFRAAGASERYLSWAVFAALVVAGVTTALQASRIGRVGAGHVIITGPGPIFIGVCITALAEGGPAMMASLVVVSALVQFALAAWLPMLRRIVTPVVSGTATMLIASSVVSIALDLLDDVPEGGTGRCGAVHRCGDAGGRHGARAARFGRLAAVVSRSSASSRVVPSPRCSGHTTSDRWSRRPGSAFRRPSGRDST